MNTLARTLLGLAMTAALVLTGSSSPIAAHQSDGVRAAAPRATFHDVTKQCSTYTSDGQEQVQCQAAFVVSGTRLMKGHTVTVVQAPQGSVMKRTVGRFTSKGRTASKRYAGQVCSFGEAPDPVRLRFYVVVRDAQRKMLLKTTPKAVC